ISKKRNQLYVLNESQTAGPSRLVNIGPMVVVTETALIVRLTMDIDMDAGIMATIMDMGASLAAIKAAAVWINGGGHVRKETFF
ncbi:MAG: hypothetical protein PUA52_08465, partial [Lachnospiraceae bacterium]|nr:hypothetical protein [Lachnospiraceae bacterium]